MFWATRVLKFDFRFCIVSFNKCKDCGGQRPAPHIGPMLCSFQLISIALLLDAHTKTLEKVDRNLTKERFLLFPQRCFLRNTADLLHFLLHRVLSVTTEKFVCCRNAIHHTLRENITCGSFQLYIWRQNLKDALSFSSPLWIKLAFTLIEDIIIQWEPEKQDKNQISEEKLWNMSDLI